MDFHGLSRRELQSLCKKNKIPANMTNIAMADALSALPNVEGIEDIGKSLPETPITCRKTSTRKPTKPQSDPIENEPESSLPNTRTRRAPRRLVQEEEQENKEPNDVTENPSLSEIPKTPATRTCRKRATGTSVSRKIGTQTKEKEKEIPVVPHAYSTRRSTRLQQSEQKVSESVQRRGGRRREAVKIDMLSEEETDNLQKESKSQVIDEVQKNEGTNVKVQDDMVYEDVPATVVSAESLTSEITGDSECTEEFTVEYSNGDQDVNSEESSATVISAEDSSTNIAHVLGECKEEFAVEDSNGDLDVTSVDSSAIVISAKDTGKNIAHVLDESSPVEEKTQNLEDSMMNSLPSAEEQCMKDVDQAIENNEYDEGKSSHDLELKLVVEDELCDVKVTEVVDIVLDESSALEEKTQNLEDSNGECLMNSLPSHQDQANEINEDELYDVKVTEVEESSLQSEVWDFGCIKDSVQEIINYSEAQQEYQDADLPVPKLKSIIVSLPSEVSSDIQIESEKSVADDVLENQMDVNVSYESEDLELESEKFSTNANVDAADFDITADTTAILDDEVQWSDSEISDSDVVEEVSDVVEKISFSSATTAPTLNQIPISVLMTPTKLTASENQIQVTPLKSSTKKKPPTTPIIKVLDDNLENNECGKVSLRSNSKVLPVVAEEKENNENRKGENTAQKKNKDISLRQLRKMLRNIKVADDKTTIITTTENNKNTAVKEQLEKKRSALQTLNENCLVGEKEN
ncbi:hypothetical protein BVC80_1833g141 [Macleaya cordata]|uniref:Uncharacterized protein n=1 Tax=Macleaya cordata TaxID=56857 RepID=A0A200R717_MACCD|nr:hypothetical protein BVC80_1833g141 [Macleaya cordata]